MSKQPAADDLTLPIKRTDGETIEKRLTDNAYHNILPARYLRKDSSGTLTEQQEDLFRRVARNIALAEAVFEARKRDTEVTVRPDQLKPDHPRRDELAAEVFGAGVRVGDDAETGLSEHNVNKFAYETVVPELPEEIREHVETTAGEFREAMEMLSFVPNSPTLMNAGDELQQLSACFVDSPEDDIDDIHQTAKEAAEVFQCLTEESTVHVEGRGMVPVSDVEVGDRVAQRSESGFQYRPVEETHAYEDAETLTVQLANGLTVRGTPNHRLMVDGGWSRLDEVRAGQELHYALGWLRETNPEPPELASVASDNRTIESPERLELSRDRQTDRRVSARATGVSRLGTHEQLDTSEEPVETVRQPEQLTEGLAELVGLWVGNGSWQQDRIQFRVERESVAEHIDQLSRRLFGTSATVSSVEGRYEVTVDGTDIGRWWESNFDCTPDGARSARVPRVLKSAPANVVESFLRGYFTADGALLDGTYPRLYSSSERAINDVATLLMGLGYPVEKSVTSDEDTRPYVTLTPATGAGRTAFLRDVGFIDERREAALSSVESAEPRDSRVIGEGYSVEVDAVVESAPATVYDITVENNREYVTDGVVSHNSGGGMGYAFWRLRPYGDAVGSTGGIASGPVTFMRTYDQMCFPPGTKVLTPDGQRPIETLGDGDLVIDENGEEQPVVETMERHVDERIVEITPERLNRPIRATAEHPFKIAREDGFAWVDAGDLSEGDLLVLGHAAEENGLSLSETLDLSSVGSSPMGLTDGGATINRGVYRADTGPTPESISSEVPVEAFATIAGWYLADGCVVYRRGVPNRVTFTLHAGERAGAREIAEALDAFGALSRTEIDEDRNTLCVHVESSNFAQLIEGLFGAGAAEKRVPELLWDAPVETQARVLETLFDGDASLERRGDSQQVQLRLRCEEVIDFVFQAGVRCGVQFSRHHRVPDDCGPTDCVSVSLGAAVGTPLEQLFGEVPEGFTAADRTERTNGAGLVAIDEVETVQYNGPVYNAEVAGTHTYVAEDVVVHNCETIAQGGARRGAQMGVMRVSHPDVIQFIHAKNKDVSLANTLRLNDPDDFTHTSFADALEEARELIDDDGRVPEHLRNAVEGHLSNFNISVGVTDRFMQAVENDEAYTFTNPRTEEPHVATAETAELYEMFGLGEHVEVGEVLSVPARKLWEQIIEGAHENGEPGVVYLERINKQHSFNVEEHPDHRILSTNPCVTGDTLISTEDGLITAEKLHEQGVARDIVVDGRLSEERVKRASSVYRTGEKEVHRLTTEEGYQLRLTADHRVMTDDGWVAAENLDAGDTVHIQNRKGEFGQHGSVAEGRVLGWLVGDGQMKTSEERAVVQFYDQDTELSEEFAGYVNDIVRNPVGNADYEVGVSQIQRSESHREHDEAGEERVRSERLYELAANFGLDSEKLQVPDAVFQASEEMVRGFLQALFTADGGVQGNKKNGRSIRLASSDIDLLKQTQQLLLQFGIASNIYRERRPAHTKEMPDRKGGTKRYETQAHHELVITKDNLVRFDEEIGFLLDKKEHQLQERLESYVYGPQEESFEATVADVDPDGIKQVYDLTEKDTHSFIANGINVHNCGEQPLEEYEACNLGHINLSTLAAEDTPDWRVWSERHAEEYATQEAAIEAFLEAAIDFEEFDRRIELGTRFLENVVTMSDFPVEKIEQTVREMRKIGLGIMGLAQLYIQLGIKYGSDAANEIARQLMVHINHQSKQTSHDLATERGVFAEWDDSKYADPTEYREWFEHHTGLPADEWADGFPMRNHNTTTIAPTGTTSMVGNTTGGCEPIYNVAYYKNVSDDVQGDEMLVEFDDYFLRVLEDNGIDVETVKQEATTQMAENRFDGVDGLSTVPDAIGELFVTTGDLSAKQHASVQCACQQGVDSAISKCLSEGTLIQTDSGVRPVESFTDDQPEQGTFAEVTEDVSIGGVSVESQYYAGEKNATRVRVDNGTELVGATESHRVLTPDGWTVLGELDEGDCVIGQHVESHGDGGRDLTLTGHSNIAADGGTATAASGVDSTVCENDLALPEEMSARLSRFLGMYAADGTAIDAGYSIEISTSSEQVRDEVSELFAELFGREPAIERDTRGGDQRDPVYGIALNSKPVWEFVTDLCGSGAYGKTVPVEVLRGSPEEKLAFINGVTLSGCVSSQSLVVYGGMSAQLADGVAELLRSFGVPKVYVDRKGVGESGSHSYQVHVTNKAQELVTPVEPHKRVDRFDQRYRVYVSQDEVDRTGFTSRSTEQYPARGLAYRDGDDIYNTTAEKLGISDAPPLYEVTAVEDAGTREMYDIELAGPHEYVVGGIVSHNTVNAPNDSTVADAKEVFEYIYDHGGKGVTYYRDGTRSKQVLTTRAQNTEFAEMDEEEAITFVVEKIDELFGGIEGFLESEEIRGRLSADIEELFAEETRQHAQKKPRPDQLQGVTQRIETGYGKLYVTINEDPETGEPFELFANTGHSGGFTNSFTDALAKTISVALRSGVDPYEIVDKIQSIRSPKVAWDKGEQINSIPDAFGTALRRYLDEEVDTNYPDQATLDETAGEHRQRGSEGSTSEPETDGAGAATRDAATIESDHQSVVDAGENPECPDCGSLSLYYSEGCKTCESCGWSEC